MGVRFVDQHCKLQFLEDHGRCGALRSRQSQELAVLLGIKPPTWSTYKSNASDRRLPQKHETTLAGLFGFDRTWLEWREGSAAAFEARYRREVLGEASGEEEPEYLRAMRAVLEELRALSSDHPSLHNYIAEIERFADPAFEAAAKPEADLDEIDVEMLRSFQRRLEEGFRLTGASRPARGGLAMGLAKRLSDLIERLGALEREDAEAGLTDEMRGWLRAALDEAKLLLQSGLLDRGLRRSLEHFVRTAESALDCGGLDLSEIDGAAALIRKHAGARFARGSRAVMICVGAGMRGSGAMPKYAAFTDGPEPWRPEMIVIPEGKFAMGSPQSEPEREDDETLHEVTIRRRFALARFTATFEEYDAYCDAAGVEKPEDRDWGRGRRPAIHVSWEEATAYCAWLSARSGREYRLPSEAEWEYACRAGSDTAFEPNVAQAFAGRDIQDSEVNYDAGYPISEALKGEYRQQTLPVDQEGFAPNLWGFWQMHGNVREWCADLYGSYDDAPVDGSARQRPPQQDSVRPRVFRGGSWYDSAQGCRAAFRFRHEPDFRNDYLGFRCSAGLVVSPAQASQPPGGREAFDPREGRVAEPRPDGGESPPR